MAGILTEYSARIQPPVRPNWGIAAAKPMATPMPRMNHCSSMKDQTALNTARGRLLGGGVKGAALLALSSALMIMSLGAGPLVEGVLGLKSVGYGGFGGFYVLEGRDVLAKKVIGVVRGWHAHRRVLSGGTVGWNGYSTC